MAEYAAEGRSKADDPAPIWEARCIRPSGNPPHPTSFESNLLYILSLKLNI